MALPQPIDDFADYPRHVNSQLVSAAPGGKLLCAVHSALHFIRLAVTCRALQLAYPLHNAMLIDATGQHWSNRVMTCEHDDVGRRAVSQNSFLSLLGGRLENQAATHWQEFSQIVASGGLLIVIGAANLLLTRSIAFDALAVLIGMLLVSVAAFGLAYYSMQVGALTLVGPLTAADVTASFLIAASQLAMPLWLGNLLRQEQRIDGIASLLPGARHWFGLFACFALSAAYANHRSATRRRCDDAVAPLLAGYSASQQDDRRNALRCGLLAAAAWAAMLRWQPAPAILASLLSVFMVGVVRALVNQSAAIQYLTDMLAARASSRECGRRRVDRD